jgi:hypothetical protein
MDEMDQHDATPEAVPTEAAAPRSRIRFELPEGWLGVLLLLIVAALSGGLIASYWPSFIGGGDLGTTQDRLAALEARVGEIATGHAGAAATGVFNNLRHDIAALGQRLDADEARLAGLEKSSEQAGGGDLAPVRQKLDAATKALTDVTARLTKLESAHGAGDLSPLTTKLAALDARVGALEADIAHSVQTLNGTVSGMDARLKPLEANAPPPNLAQRLDSFALKTDADSIDARLKTVEAQNTGESLHHAAAMLALARLAHAVNQPGPFALELDTLAVAAPGDPVIAVLQPYAATGVPAKPVLATEFPNVARAALDAERSGDARTLFQRLWANILGLISMRRVGEVVGNDTESRLARVQAKLDVNDLAAAVAEVRALKGPAAKVTAFWLKDAEARLQLDHAVADMSARVIQALAATPSQAVVPAPIATVPPAAPVQVRTPAQGGKP